MSLNHLQQNDYLGAISGGDFHDQASNFDTETFMSDDLGFAPATALGHPSLHRYSSSGFDDNFADPNVAHLDGLPPEQAIQESSVDRDNKLLGFSMPIYSFTLLDYSLRRTSLSLSAQLHGMFFLAESQWTSSPDAPPPPPELTCYRRNLFQVQGSITLPRSLRYIMTEQGDRIPILAQELTISATESVEGNPVKIISVPWKTPAGNAPGPPEEKIEKEPPSIPLDTMGGQDMDVDYATFTIAWKRLQFRIATANNGRRKELQQHFVIRLKVMATLSTGQKIAIAESHSGAIIVRGRSPRNFQSRKDYPLGNSGSSRKSMHPPITRTSTGESANQPPHPTQQDITPPDMTHMMLKPELEFSQSSPDFPEWQQMSQQATIGINSLPTPTFSNPMLQGPLPAYNHNTNPDILSPSLPMAHPSVSAMQQNAVAANGPISLSFSDDENSPNHSPFPTTQPIKSESRSHSHSQGPTSNPSPSFLKHHSTPTPSHLNNHSNNSITNNINSSPSSLPHAQPVLSNPPPAKQRPRLNNSSRHPSSSSVIPRRPSHGQTPSSQDPSPSFTAADLAIPNPNINNIPTSLKTGGALLTPNDDFRTDTLYEYFPLGLDDWMPPVDAVYRPHLVHHTGPTSPGIAFGAVGGMAVGAGGMAGLGGGRFRSKRYFSEDQS
ncbi:MAG: hypothetical protein Q9160_004340 [Pyrenula sp. 1 TL-2023]